jgi:Fe-Mn family superoxide dismutase
MTMNRREALRWMSLGTAAVAAAPLTGLAWGSSEAPDPSVALRYPYSLPDLPYAPDALTAFIDEQTMMLHHGKHHAGYVNNLNKALETAPEWQELSLSELLSSLDRLPESIRTAVRNNGGGHANHALFWDTLSPQPVTLPAGTLSDLITQQFGGLEEATAALRKAALSVFGSGWAWLSYSNGGLLIETTPNQDTPLMVGHIPLFGIDVWEHAYYLRYQNRRAEYVDGVLAHVNWNAVATGLPA